jgi:hypothetical protein
MPFAAADEHIGPNEDPRFSKGRTAATNRAKAEALGTRLKSSMEKDPPRMVTEAEALFSRGPARRRRDEGQAGLGTATARAPAWSHRRSKVTPTIKLVLLDYALVGLVGVLDPILKRVAFGRQ